MQSLLQSATVILFFVCIQISGQQESTCGKLLPDRIAHMWNGIVSYHWPWHAAIYVRFDGSATYDYQCGGTLISSNYILTAGHCVTISNDRIPAANFSVSLGRLNLGVRESNAQWFAVIFILTFCK